MISRIGHLLRVLLLALLLAELALFLESFFSHRSLELRIPTAKISLSLEAYSGEGHLWITVGWIGQRKPGDGLVFRCLGSSPVRGIHCSNLWDFYGNVRSGESQRGWEGPVRYGSVFARFPHWVLLLILAVPQTRWLFGIKQRQRIRRLVNEHCPKCNYDVRGIENRCPECGDPVARSQIDAVDQLTANLRDR
jgi:hypothetical protein